MVGNKGSCGVDGMPVEELKEYLSTHQSNLVRNILDDNYLPNAIRGVEIPKSNGKKRLLGIPTVVDRWPTTSGQSTANDEIRIRILRLQFWLPTEEEHATGFETVPRLYQ